MKVDKSDIYISLSQFLSSQSNIGHFDRAKNWASIENKKLEEIFENQEFKYYHSE